MNQSRSAFTCPHCRQPLDVHGGSLACSAGHQFDIAREGYVNLLPVNRRRSRNPGDSAEMVAARRRFLEIGHFDALSVALADQFSESRFQLSVDLGCGEGHFTQMLRPVSDRVCGVDVSRAAIRRAARTYPAVEWAVASSAALPLGDAACDCVLVVIAPVGKDIARVVRSEGVLFRVAPGTEHLEAFRATAFADPRPHREPPTELEGFVHTSRSEVRDVRKLAGGALGDLLDMTPMRFRTTPERQAALRSRSELEVPIHFLIDRFVRASDAPAAPSSADEARTQ